MPRRPRIERRAFATVDEYREGYEEGYDDGYREGSRSMAKVAAQKLAEFRGVKGLKRGNPHPKKRKLSDWNKYVKANSKKPRFKYRNGKLNLKKMGVAFRKTPAGKKKKS